MTLIEATRRLQSIVTPTASFAVTPEVWRHANFGGRLELHYRVTIFSDDNLFVRFQQNGTDLAAIIAMAEAEIAPAALPEVEAISAQVEEVALSI